MRLISWKRIDRSPLQGVADVELDLGLRILGVMVFRDGARTWISLPSKPLIGPDGQQIINEANGKPAYQPILAWRDTKLADAFRRAVVRLVREAHPGTFAAGGDR
jgi:hypothetical protein